MKAYQSERAELILRQFLDFASLAQNDVFPAAVSPLVKAQDDGGRSATVIDRRYIYSVFSASLTKSSTVALGWASRMARTVLWASACL